MENAVQAWIVEVPNVDTNLVLILPLEWDENRILPEVKKKFPNLVSTPFKMTRFCEGAMVVRAVEGSFVDIHKWIDQDGNPVP